MPSVAASQSTIGGNLRVKQTIDCHLDSFLSSTKFLLMHHSSASSFKYVPQVVEN